MSVFFLLILLAVIICAMTIAGMCMVATKVGGGDSGARGRAAARDIVKDLKASPRTKSEAFVVQILEEITGLKFPTVNPSWLRWRGRTLELDGYNESARLAIEFSGPLHTKWTPSAESYLRYIQRVIRDMVKVKMCARNGVDLIVIDQTLPREHVRAYLESRLHDFGRRERPANYIPAQTVEPFRNPQLEAELGLGGEIAALRRVR
jgi:hypothetical protein